LESDQIPLPVDAGKISLTFRPFEIKTIRLQLGSLESQSSR